MTPETREKIRAARTSLLTTASRACSDCLDNVEAYLSAEADDEAQGAAMPLEQRPAYYDPICDCPLCRTTRITVAGVETTAQERALRTYDPDALLRDFARQSAEIARLTASNEEYDRLLRDEQVRVSALLKEQARLTAELAEVRSIIEASPAVQKAMGHFHTKLNERYKAERDQALADVARAPFRSVGLRGAAQAAQEKIASVLQTQLPGAGAEAAATEQGRIVSIDDFERVGEDAAPMTGDQIRQWIDACNHEPAKEVLRHYLRLTSPAPSPVAGMETTAEDRKRWMSISSEGRASYLDEKVVIHKYLDAACRDIDRQSAEIARLTAELAEARDYVEEQIDERINVLNADGEAFDKECHNALRWLLINECGAGGQELVDDVDGWSAENATQCIAECLREARADVAKAREEERGACLIIAHDAEKLVGSVISTAASEWRNACRHIAAAIRARSTGTLPADRKPWFADEAAAAFGVDRNVLARRLVAFADTLANDDADLIMEAVAFIRLPAAVPADRA